MRVERLELHAYGHYQDTVLDLSGPEHGITVLYGPNEAGKSTARRALVAALFGIERGTSDAHRHGPYGLRLGASLQATDGAMLSIVRHGVSGLAQPDGSPIEESRLDHFLGGIGKLAFTRLFAVDHEELRRGSESLLEADGEIGRLVFGASLGSGSVSAVLARLDERASSLYRDRGSAQRIPRALKAYQEGMKSARAARVRARAWDHLREDVELAQHRVDGARDAFMAAQADQLRMSRLQAARPLVDRRSRLRHQLAELGPAPSAEWAARAKEALDAYRQARGAHERAAATRRQLTGEVEGIVVPTAVLEVAESIGSLVRGTDRYDKDARDLPTRRLRHEQELQAVHEQLERLGKSTDDGTIVADSDLAEVERLARQHPALELGERAAAAELERATERIAELRAQRAGLTEPVEVEPLARALERARAKLDVARSLPTQCSESTAAAAQLHARAGRLGLGALDRDGIESLVVPAVSDVEAERERREKLGFEDGKLRDEHERLETELSVIVRQIEEMATGIPDPEGVIAARGRRDTGWRAVRATVEGGEVAAAWASGGSLLDAYEEAVADADAAADERYVRAEAIARIEQLQAQRAEAVRKSAALARRAHQLGDADAVASATWASRWASIGVEAGTPAAMLQWLAEQRELVVDIGRWRRDEAKLAAVTLEVDQHAAALRAALDAFAQPSLEAALEPLVTQASAVVGRARGEAETRRALDKQVDAAERDLPKRELELESRRRALDEWRPSWEVALRALGMAASTSTDSALVAVAIHRELTTARREASSLAKRIAGIERDCSEYTERVGEVAGALGVDTRTPLDAVAELDRQLRAAQQAHQRRQALQEQLADAEDAWKETATTMDAASGVLVAFRLEVAIPADRGEPDVGVDDHVDRAQRHADLRAQLAAVEEDLVHQGGGSEIDRLEADVLAAGDRLDAELATLAHEVRVRQAELEEKNLQLADAQKAFAAVSDAATAADLEQEAEADFSLASSLVTEYARTALAAEILRRTIAEYGEQHREPLLDRATELLALMTEGAFVKLVTAAEGERQVVLVQRPGGEHCRVGDLSDGTRDQLYLALRIAGIEHQLLQSPEPLPVILDDVLVHFDDRRAAAAIRSLGALGARTQVLLFTHHEHVVETVQREMGPGGSMVVRLEPREAREARDGLHRLHQKPVRVESSV